MTASQRILAGSTATISWQAVDQYGAPSDPGVTTVAATGSDGAPVLTGVVSGAGTAPRTTSLLVANPDLLTVTWAGATATGSQVVEVAGGLLVTVAEVRAAEPTVVNPMDYPDAQVAAAVDVVESMFEQSCRVAFVPRLRIVRVADLDKVPMLRLVRWRQDGGYVNDDTYVAARAGVEWGYDSPPPDVKRAARLAVRHLLTSANAQVDFRVTAVVNPDGSREQLATPGLSLWVTGIPEVDEVLKRYRWPVPLSTSLLTLTTADTPVNPSSWVGA